MSKTYTLKPDGSIAVVDPGLVPGQGAQWTIAPQQIAAHARDPQFFAGAPADVAAVVSAAVKASSSS
jgi:hypothetical protein